MIEMNLHSPFIDQLKITMDEVSYVTNSFIISPKITVDNLVYLLSKMDD